MANLKCTVVWLVPLLLIHFNPQLISSSPIRLKKPMSTENTSLVCPVYPPPAECPPEPDHECNSDQECAELYPGLGMKCCRDGCDNMVCVAPVPRPTSPVNGTCPVYPPPAECPPEEDLDNECTDDAECNQLYPGLGLKCCHDGCEYMCVAPVDGKVPTCTRPPTSSVNGTCPVFPEAFECPPEPDHECNNDQECSELHPGLGMKCCLDGCDMRCVTPVQGNTPTTPPPTSSVNGTCPVFPEAPECPPEPDHECNNDQECAELHPGLGMKCCRNGCDRMCVAPVQGNTPTTQPPTSSVNGTCPVYPPPAECPPEPGHECNSDQECAELYPGLGMKCCRDGCDNMVCVAPVPPPTSPVNGTCPVYPPPAECPPDEDLDNECMDDTKCNQLYPGLGMKCCHDGCEYICVSPVDGKVPTTRPPTSSVNGTCPVYPPPAECPPEEDLDNECMDDTKCNQLYPGSGLKCCHDGCEYMCVAPVNGKVPTTRPPTSSVNGTCPVYPPPAECPPEEDLDNECMDDTKCNQLYPGSGLKCCHDGCEYMCVAPLR